METVSLSKFVQQAATYEEWRAHFDSGLRRFTQLSGLSLASMLVTLLVLPPSFLGGSEAFISLKYFLMGLHIVALAAYASLLVATNGLKSGRAPWHWVAMGEVVLGAIDALILTVSIAVLVLAFVLSIIAIFIAIAVLLAGLSQA